MNSGIIIRPAKDRDRAKIKQLFVTHGSDQQLTQSILNHTTLVAGYGTGLLGCAAVDLDRKEMTLSIANSTAWTEQAGQRLLEAIERLASQYGVMELGVKPTASTLNLLVSCGYTRHKAPTLPQTKRGRDVVQPLKRTFPRRQTRYSRRIFALLNEFGIPRDYPITHRMPLQPESSRLESIGQDVFQREQQMLPAAAKAWLRMKKNAAADGIEIQAVSAFRSVDYQAGIVQRKLDKGQSMEKILEVSAAPGFSEHHTGKAIDITTPGFEVLEEVFEQSPAFEWLTLNAGKFGFRMSFPRDNHHGVAYEPWHWAWKTRM